MNTNERKEHLLTVSKTVNNIPYSWKELSLAVEGRFTNLRIWIGNSGWLWSSNDLYEIRLFKTIFPTIKQ